MFRIENTPSINYIWVGPPSPSQKKETSVGLEEKNHDLIGPIKMSQLNNSNRIVFWCLDAHVASYKKKFNGIKIEVRSIEKIHRRTKIPQ